MPSVNAQPANGFWGKTSSTIDWCEENYVVTYYIAEFWNTVSNLMMIIPPFLAALYAISQGVERRMVICHLGLLTVGVGSWCFHMTLRYSMQLLDELPMIWSSMVLIYSMIEVDKPLKTHNRQLQAALVLFCFLVTVVYLVNKTPLFFQVSYSVMVLGMIIFTVKYMVKYGWQLKLHIQILAMGSYLLGVACWMAENKFCSNIRGFRSETVSAVAPVTQLHAWWHLFAGYGTYVAIVFLFHSRYTVHSQRPRIKLLLGLWPYLDLTQPLKHV